MGCGFVGGVEDKRKRNTRSIAGGENNKKADFMLGGRGGDCVSLSPSQVGQCAALLTVVLPPGGV